MKVMLKVRSILSIAFLFRGVNMEKVVKIISVSILAIIILGFVWFVLDYTFGLAPTEIVTVVDEDTGFTYEYNKNSLNTRLSNFLDFTKVALYIEVALSFVLAAYKGKNEEIEKRELGELDDTAPFDITMTFKDIDNGEDRYVQSFKMLNNELNGVCRKNGVMFIGASSGSGKTTVTLQMVLGLIEAGEKVLFISNEQTSRYFKNLLIVENNIKSLHA